MVRLIGDQIIPDFLLEYYLSTLKPSTAPRRWSGRRYPWRVKRMQGTNWGVSESQLAQRTEFIKSKDCFLCQPSSGGAEPPDNGPRSREWWYSEAAESGLWYYDFFMQTTLNTYLGLNKPDWCWKPLKNISCTYKGNPNHSYYADWYGLCGHAYGNPMYVWVKKLTNIMPRINLLVWALYPNEAGNGFFQIDIREQLVDWDYGSLTWNTQPALGAVVASSPLMDTSNGKLVRIAVPKAVTNFSITMPVHNYGYIYFALRRDDVTDGVAVMGP